MRKFARTTAQLLSRLTRSEVKRVRHGLSAPEQPLRTDRVSLRPVLLGHALTRRDSLEISLLDTDRLYRRQCRGVRYWHKFPTVPDGVDIPVRFLRARRPPDSVASSATGDQSSLWSACPYDEIGPGHQA